MRKSCVLAKAAKDSTLHTQRAKCGSAIPGKLVLRHAPPSVVDSRFVRGYRDVVRTLHEGNLSWRFEHAPARSYWCRANKLESRCRFANAIEKEKAHSLFLKLGTHPGNLTARRNDGGKHSLASAPAHAGVIKHARAGFNI